MLQKRKPQVELLYKQSSRSIWTVDILNICIFILICSQLIQTQTELLQVPRRAQANPLLFNGLPPRAAASSLRRKGSSLGRRRLGLLQVLYILLFIVCIYFLLREYNINAGSSDSASRSRPSSDQVLASQSSRSVEPMESGSQLRFQGQKIVKLLQSMSHRHALQ